MSPTLFYKFKEKLEILSSIRDHRKKSRETREVAYTCRYTSEHLIPNPFAGVACFSASFSMIPN